jgi:NADPH:quinone reductase-like Zn-dependent oxidoreductase
MTALPNRMTVIAIRQPGGPEVLTPESRPVPQPAAGEILVKIAAAGVNRPDVMQRMRRRKAQPIFPALRSRAKSSRAAPG